MQLTLLTFTLVATATCTFSLPLNTTTAACERVYRVQGTEETCVGIAVGMGVAPTDIRAANQHMLCDAKKLPAGTELCLARATGSEGISTAPPAPSMNIASALQIAAISTATWQATMRSLLCKVNSERKLRGLKPLAWNAKLAKAAQLHTTEMATYNFLSHNSRNGRTFDQRITAQKYTWRAAGENIAMGYRTVDEVMKGWMNSPGHRANILSTTYVHFGAGIAYSKSGASYWTQDFASDGSAATTVQCPASVPALT